MLVNTCIALERARASRILLQFPPTSSREILATPMAVGSRCLLPEASLPVWRPASVARACTRSSGNVGARPSRGANIFPFCLTVFSQARRRSIVPSASLRANLARRRNVVESWSRKPLLHLGQRGGNVVSSSYLGK